MKPRNPKFFTSLPSAGSELDLLDTRRRRRRQDKGDDAQDLQSSTPCPAPALSPVQAPRTSTMNPSDLLLNRPQASTSGPQQPNQFQPYASTSSLPSSGFANGVTLNGNTQAMETDEPSGKPKSRKEQEQDKKDLELGELLEMIDEWKPIVSPRERGKNERS